MFAVQIVRCAIALAKCVMGATLAKEKFFMHRKEKPVRFMIVSKTINVCKIVGNAEKYLARYGLIPETRCFQMKNLTKM